MKIDNWNPCKQSTTIVGYTQTGKTNLAVFLCWLLGVEGYNLKIADPNEKFGILNPSFVVHSLDEIKPEGIQILQTDLWTKELFDELCKKVFSYRNNRTVFVCDELHTFAKKYHTEENFDLFCRNCHNRNIGYIFITQRPQETATMAFSNSTHRFAFKMDYPSDVEMMRQWIGEDYVSYMNTEYQPHTGIYKRFGNNGTEIFKVRKMYD